MSMYYEEKGREDHENRGPCKGREEGKNMRTHVEPCAEPGNSTIYGPG